MHETVGKTRQPAAESSLLCCRCCTLYVGNTLSRCVGTFRANGHEMISKGEKLSTAGWRRRFAHTDALYVQNIILGIELYANVSCGNARNGLKKT
jgi:hypothetical protein